jgi:hypothetical protein
MDRRTRICIWIIFLGLLNFVAYAILYAEVGGDARNGYIGVSAKDGQREYYVAGHFLRVPEGQFQRVAPWVWIYSYVHSITIWPTEAAVLVCLLILARPHIIATMKENALMQGSTFVAVCSTIVVLLASALTIWFVIRFISQLTAAGG